jgi:hypothetical protein
MGMKTFLAILCLLGIITFTYPAWGQELPCFPRDDAVNQLAEKYGESPRFAAVTNKGALMEIFVNDISGTYTITFSRSPITLCLIDAGEGWHETDAPKAGTES